LIITFESAGSQQAAVVGQALNLPYLVARKKKFDLPHEIAFVVATNFDEKIFYIYGNMTGKRYRDVLSGIALHLIYIVQIEVENDKVVVFEG